MSGIVPELETLGLRASTDYRILEKLPAEVQRSAFVV